MEMCPAWCLENNSINGDAINNNDKHLLTIYCVRYTAQYFTCIIYFNPLNDSMS